MVTLVYVHMAPDELDQFRFLENCLPTLFLTQRFAPSETQMLTLSWGRVGGQFPTNLNDPTNFRPTKKFNGTLRSHRTVQYLRSVPMEL